MTQKHIINLQPSEAVVAKMAATIYAAFIQGGMVTRENENSFIEIAGNAAIKLAEYVDSRVKSEDEVARSSDGMPRL
jgi:hypothetical protein